MRDEFEEHNYIWDELENNNYKFNFIKNPYDDFSESNIAVDEEGAVDPDELRRDFGDELADEIAERKKNGWTEWEVKDGVLRHYGGNLKRVRIPDCVTEIADGAFSSSKYLEEVTMPDTVTKLGARAFGWCENLRKIVLGNGVTEIGERAFISCGYLRKVILSNSLQIIGNCAFWLCSSLKKIEIPKSVKQIGKYAFMDCIRLTDAEIDDAKCTIGSEAFRHCDFWHIYIGENVTEIGDGAFADSSLVNLTIPESVKKIGKNIFDGCKNFHWAQCMAQSQPDGWDTDWDKNNGKRVKKVWNWGFTNGVIKFYDKSKFFIEGNKLKKYIGGVGEEEEIEIPDGVYTVAEDTFDKCTSIEKLIIPASVKYFEDDMRWGLTKVKKVYFLGTLKEWKEIYFEDCELTDVAEEIYVGGKKIK